MDLSKYDPFRIGVYNGSGETGLESAEFFRAMSLAWSSDEERDFKYLGGRPSRLIDPYFSLRTLSNAGTSFLSLEFGARGPNSSFVHGGTASSLAVGTAVSDLLDHRCDVALAGGYDSLLYVSTYLAYDKQGLLARGPSTPYLPGHPAPGGLVLGEGAGYLVLETQQSAHEREVPVLAEIVGQRRGMVGDASENEEFLKSALEEFGLDDVDFVVAHGIGIEEEDRSEIELLENVCRKPTVTALKGTTSYLGAASGVVELAFGILGLVHRQVPPMARADYSDARPGWVGNRKVEVCKPETTCLVTSRSWSGQFTATAARRIAGQKEP